MNIFISKNRVINPLSIPVSCTAFAAFLLCILSLFLPNTDYGLIISLMFSALCTVFITLYYTNDSKLSACLCSCVVLSDILFYTLCSTYFGIGFITLYAVALALGFKKNELEYSFIGASVIAVALPVLLYLLKAPINALMSLLAATLAQKPTLFGAVNNAYSMMFDGRLGEMIYFKGYSGSYLINNEIVSGVINSFLSRPDNPPKSTSEFLTGQYYANLFLPVGIYIALFSRIKNNFILPFTLTLALSVIFGSNVLFCVLLFFYNPFIYFGYLLAVAVGYLVPRFMHLAVGFERSASIIELFKYADSRLYFILIGVVLVVMMYFICILILSKYDLASKRYYPKEVRYLINALGGERNIINIENAKLYVSNPNLINVLKVDCEIKGNEVTLIDNDLELLYDYFS